MEKIPSHYWVLAMVLMVTAVVFGAVCGHEFLSYDDEINIYGNRYVTTFSLANLGHFWVELYENLYIPLTYNLWTVLARLAGFIPTATAKVLSPIPFHAANLLLHLGSTALLFLIIRGLVGDDWGAAGGALLFAVHPVQVEAVSWATGMKDVWSGFLALLALWQYLVYARLPDEQAGRYRHYALAAVAYSCAILAKPGVVMLPLAAALVGFLMLSRPWRRLARELLPWCVLALPLIVLTKIAQPTTDHILQPEPWQRLLVAGDALSFYGYKLLFPFTLGPDYGRTPQFVLSQGWIYLTGALPYLLGAVLGWKGPRPAQVAVGILMIMLLPVLGLVSFDFQEYSTVADRYLYTGMLGPALGGGWLLARYRSLRAVTGGALLVLILCGGMSMLQVRHWRNSFTFYRHALRVNPASWFALNNLGLWHESRNELAEAGRYFEQALDQRPDSYITCNNLGIVRSREGRWEAAEKLFARALELNPDFADAAVNMGGLYARRGEVALAKGYFLRALAVKPDLAGVHSALGDLALGERRTGEALELYRRALALGPGTVKIYNNLGLVYQALGRKEEAINCYQQALSINPDSAEVHNNLGMIYSESGHQPEAILQFEQATRLIPEEPQPLYNLGRARLARGEYEAARQAFQAALNTDPGFAPALAGLARLYRLTGRDGLATEYAGRARALGYTEAAETP